MNACPPIIRPAVEADVPEIVALLADDALGATRETPGDLAPYRAAFRAIAADPNQLLTVMERSHVIVGTLQLTFVPGLSRRGATRATIEGVRIAAGERGSGLGRVYLEWAIEEARKRGCTLVQLTSDLQRPDAIRFYEGLGFDHSHAGMKRTLV